VFFGTEFTQEVEVTARKTVHCEGCGADYAYLMSRVGSGRDCAPYGLGERRAAQAAHDKAAAAARQELECGCELVPCPECGLYQSAMVNEARRRRLRWMSFISRRLLFVLLVLFTVGLIAAVSDKSTRLPPAIITAYWIVMGALGGLGLALWMCQKMLSSRYDPNAIDVEHRKRIGRSLAQLCK
jgi:hypothetical protein